MFCHLLKVTKDGEEFEIQCEDSPLSEGLICIWPYEHGMSDSKYSEVVSALHDWATSEGLKYRIYVTREHFEPNTVYEK